MNQTQSDSLLRTLERHLQPLQPRPTNAEPVLPTLEGIGAVVFDVYGTLLISASGEVGITDAEDDAQHLAAALEEAGFDAEDMQELAELGVVAYREAIAADHRRSKQAGCTTPEVDVRDIWRRVLSDLIDHDQRAEITNERVELLAVAYEARVNPTWPMPGGLEVLRELHEGGVHLGIISNAQFYTPLLFRVHYQALPSELGVDPALCAWSYAERTAKPGTELYDVVLAALYERYDLSPDAVLYVGNDLRNDVWPARTCRCRTALFAGDARSLRWREDDPQLAEVKPDAVVTDLRQIPALVGLATGTG